MSIVSMTERVELEKGNRKPSEVEELNLDNSKATEIEGLSDKFECLEYLSLVNVGLQSLNGLPNLCALKKIDLADNRLTGNLEHFINCPKLEQVILTGNKIKSTEVLLPLAKLTHLRCLDLHHCEVTELAGYRQDVFELIPHLKYLDGFDKNNLESEELTNGETRESAGDAEGDEVDEEDAADASNTRTSRQRNVADGADVAEGDDEEDEEDYDYEEGDEEEGDEDDEDEDEDEEEEDEEDEEVGLRALQNSKEIEDDGDDYAPPEGYAEDEDEADLDEDDDDQDVDEVNDDSAIANLSAAGVTGARRPDAVKRRASTTPAKGGASPTTAKLSRPAAPATANIVAKVTNNGDSNDP